MRCWRIGAYAVLSSVAVHADAPGTTYANVGAWEISTEPERKLCKMFHVYGSSKDSHVEGLFIRYDAAKEEVWPTWTTDAAIDLPPVDQSQLPLEFVKGTSLNGSWGNRLFQVRKRDATTYVSHTFRGPKNARQVLDHLAASEVFGLSLGPAMITGRSLDASRAAEMLRKCSLETAAPSAVRSR